MISLFNPRHIRRGALLCGVVAAFISSAGGGFAESSGLGPVPKVIHGSEVGVGMQVPDLVVHPREGKVFQLSELKGAKAVVIAFTSATCPVSKRYASNLANIEKDFSERGARMILVNPIASDSESEISEQLKEHGIKAAYARDNDGKISKALAARSTTEVFLLDATRTIVYRGAIDDQYGIGYSSDTPKRKFLRSAIEAVLNGTAPEISATTAPGCSLESADGKVNPEVEITYTSRIARIVQRNCIECHHPGGVAPFSLETYEDVVGHAGMIRKVIDGRIMPPWFAAPIEPGHHSPWANDRSLPERDRKDLLAWIAGGKPKGKDEDAPIAKTFSKEWRMGEPDALIQIPEAIEVQANGKMPYQNVFVQTNFGEDKWLRGLEVRPTARDVVHHVLVFVSKEKGPEPGGRKKRSSDNEAGNYLAAYVPGNNLLQYGDGFAKLLPAGATLHFQIHYTPNGTATRDQTRLGLKFAKEPPEHEVRVAAISNPWFRIPPGEENYEVKGTLPVMFNSKILAFMPHMHMRGKAYRYELVTPDGEKKVLLDVPNYDFNWQLLYRLIEPVDAPAGSRLLGTAWYNNSASNPANPDPAKEVKWGPQTDDEMMLGYLEFYVPSLKPGDTPTLNRLVGGKGELLFDLLDKNQDGKITLDEAPTQDSFKSADANGDGIVTREELAEYLKKVRPKTQENKAPAPRASAK